jgi:tetratricopeptide (TPR) repeat protein
MISDFEGDAGLPDALFWISKEYEWAKGPVQDRTGWYDAPNSVYQKLVQQFKSTSYGQQSEWGQKRLTHRIKILKLIKEADQNEINAAIEQMVAEFTGRPEVAGELCWIAREYEMYADKHELSKEMYERIIREYPESVEANEAPLDIARVDIQFLIEAGDINEANILTDEFVADFNQDPYAGYCLERIATQYYKTALSFKEQKQQEGTKQYFEQAEGVWQRIIDKLPVQAGDTDNAYYFVAGCRQQLGRWEEALDYYQKVVADWPDYKYAGGAQCAIGWSYEVLRDSGKIPKEQANPLIEQAYIAVLTDYPDCYVAHYAAFQLAEMSAEKGDKISAIAYYKKFLELAPPEHSRLAEAKAKLAKMEESGSVLTIQGGTNQ